MCVWHNGIVAGNVIPSDPLLLMHHHPLRHHIRPPHHHPNSAPHHSRHRHHIGIHHHCLHCHPTSATTAPSSPLSSYSSSLSSLLSKTRQKSVFKGIFVLLHCLFNVKLTCSKFLAIQKTVCKCDLKSYFTLMSKSVRDCVISDKLTFSFWYGNILVIKRLI